MRFSVSLPTLDPSDSRFEVTLASLLAQTALGDPANSLDIYVVSPRNTLSGTGQTQIHGRVNVSIGYVTDRGEGLYAALSRSFARHDGDVHSYLGAGDVFEPQTFTLVAEGIKVASRRHSWLTGQLVTRRQDGAIVRTTLPAPYSRKGLIRGRYTRLAPSIQQESTWWDSDLHASIDLDQLATWRLAGDYYLWKSFAQHSSPIILDAVLGSFTWHGDNMSSDWAAYLQEVEDMCGPLTVWDKATSTVYRASWALPNRLKWKFFRGQVFRWNWPDGPWT